MASDNSTVTYKDIDGFPGYRVGDDGSVWGCHSGPILIPEWRRLKPGIHRKPRSYRYLHLWRNGKRSTRLLHRIVLEAFVGPRPHGAECRHIDGNPENNRLDNLAWGTHAENTEDSRRLNRFSVKLTADVVKAIRRRSAEGVRNLELAAEFGTSITNVSSIINRRSWKHLD